MSILDNSYSHEIDAAELAAALQASIEKIKPNIDAEAGDVLSLLSQGYTLADIMDFGEGHKEALFQLGCRFMLSNDLEQASNIFLTLALLDPLEERAQYGLGVVEQTRGDLPKAAQFFLQFILLNATDPKGYLRLGECLRGANEKEEAKAAFETAKQLAEKGHGSQADVTEAKRQLNSLSRHNT